ncbi:MAG: cytochrome c oxidase subunit II [Haloarculaceae archaeon]
MSGGIVPQGSQQAVFAQLFGVFTALGTVVGAIVIGYLLWNTYRNRASRVDEDDEDRDVPELGVLPSSGHGGRHLLVSFSLSAILVLSLIVWSYGALLYLQQGVKASPPSGTNERMTVTVVGHQFYWEFQYDDVPGHPQQVSSLNELRVPQGALVRLRVTSADVFHTFGVPKLKAKSDAIPGQTTKTWFVADEKGTYLARCYELCGQGHSYMTANVTVTSSSAFDQWYATKVNSTA